MKDKYRVIYQPRGAALEYAPLACNLYIGCEHGCRYCYAPACLKLSRSEFHSERRSRKEVLLKLQRDLEEMRRSGDRRRVLFCFVSDPYSGSDNTITRSALELMREYDHPFDVLTKGGVKAAADFDLYGSDDRFAASLTFLSAERSREMEPAAALPADRLEALRLAHERGIGTWVSFEPVIDPDETERLFVASRDFVDQYKIGKASNFQYSASIDWAAFTRRMVAHFKEAGKKYLVKKSLINYMGGSDGNREKLSQIGKSVFGRASL